MKDLWLFVGGVITGVVLTAAFDEQIVSLLEGGRAVADGLDDDGVLEVLSADGLSEASDPVN
ncbi:MAG: hypothetical protein PHQ27_08125 [Victivallales bacterium]|nr:hypothetical protein [Victivallales bacterium]